MQARKLGVRQQPSSSHQVQAGLVVLLGVLHGQEPVSGAEERVLAQSRAQHGPGDQDGVSRHLLDNVVALAEHLQQRNLAQSS